MNGPSLYSSDHSLLHAVLVLFGGLDLVAVGAYLLRADDGPLSQGHRPQLAEMQAERSTQRAQGRASSGRRGGGRLSRAPVPVGGGVPAWAGSGDGAAPPMARAPQGSYEVDSDFGAVDLGTPSAPSGGATGDGRAIADAGGPTGGTPEDPNQVPLGGAEWLAAAGAAYALNRPRERESTDDESGEGSSGTS